jgi:hypothetical protein
MGMSYGGYVGAMTAQGDGRARAAINLDGGSWTYDLIDADVRTPFLMLNSDATYANARIRAAGVALPSGSYDGPLGPHTPTIGDIAYERVATAGTRPDVFRMIVPGVLHESFSDLGAMLGDSLMRWRAGDPTAVAQAVPMQNDLVLAFLDRYVRGKGNDFPGAVLAKYPRLIVRDRSDIRRQAGVRSR